MIFRIIGPKVDATFDLYSAVGFMRMRVPSLETTQLETDLNALHTGGSHTVTYFDDYYIITRIG